jgi:hypothetical protein
MVHGEDTIDYGIRNNIVPLLNVISLMPVEETVHS